MGRRSMPDRLLIIDPNNPTNDISGGSAGVERIFDKFSIAYNTMIRIMDNADKRPDDMHIPGYRSSLLIHLWGGNYESFDVQRARMQELHRNGNRYVGVPHS